jgi:integrase
MIIDLEGRRRQIGVHPSKEAAATASAERVREFNTGPVEEAMTLLAWNELWPQRVPVSKETKRTTRHRLERYVLPHLPRSGAIPMDRIRRSMVRDVQIALMREGPSKRTIDHAVGALSAVLGYALREDRIEHNPVLGMSVDPNDPLLRPARPAKQRRYVPPSELGVFLLAVKPRWLADCLTPVLTGLRPQELFAVLRPDIDRKRHLLYVHQRAARYGGAPEGEGVLRPGVKERRKLWRAAKEDRGRYTLFPAQLVALVDAAPPALSGLLFPSPRGLVWSKRNFYRDVWEPAERKAGTDFDLYDLRHTFVSALRSGGVPEPEISGYAGHAVPGLGNTTTRVYTHPTGEHHQLALEVMGDYFEAVLKAAPALRQAI